MSVQVVLIGEAREDYLFFGQVRRFLRDLGAGDAIQVELDPRDLTDEERRGCWWPQEHPRYRDALRIPDAELPDRVAAVEEKFGIPGLRRLWLGDIQYWREGVPEDELARQAIGLVEAFDALWDEHPTLRGGFFEDSGRLLKRAFRAVCLHRGGIARILLPVALPGRMVVVDQEDPREGLPPFDDFVPNEEELAAVRAHVESVRSSTFDYANPRELALSPRRIRNLATLAAKQLRGRGPGAHHVHVGYYLRDYVRQRASLEVLRRLPSPAPRERVCLYPFHYTYDSQITVRGDAFLDQLAVVDQIARALPYGWRLAVKTHPAAPGDQPLGRLLRVVRGMDNVDLVNPHVHAHTVLRKAGLLVTVNSTMGFEALMFGVPVATLGQSVYRGFGLTTDVTDLNVLPQALAEAIRRGPAPEDEILRYFAFMLRHGADIEMSAYDLSDGNAARFARAIADGLDLFRPPS